jgi:glycosyltransferase involved in cell wall biosynthesis
MILAVFSPFLGVASETFIRRHITDLCPNRTVAIIRNGDSRHGGHWGVSCPTLFLNRITVAEFSLPYSYEKGLCRIIRSFLMSQRVTVILGEFLDASLGMLAIARDLGIKFVGHGHGYDVSGALQHDAWRRLYRNYDHADGMIVPNEIARARLVELGIRPDRIHVVPCGVDVPQAMPQRPDARPIRCVAVGRMVEKKGVLFTLEAFRRALDVTPWLHLDYIGEGELRPCADRYIKMQDLGEHVALLGEQPHDVVLKYLDEADIFLQHSVTADNGDQEGLPVSILEAMARGLPVISTKHAGISEAVLHGHTGYLCSERDTAAMAFFICTLAADTSVRHALGIRAWRQAQRYFSWEGERASLLRICNP